MALPKSIHNVLEILSKASRRQPVDLSSVPAEELDDAMEAIHGLFVHDGGVRLNKAFSELLDAGERATLQELRATFVHALETGETALVRGATGRVVPGPGLDANPALSGFAPRAGGGPPPIVKWYFWGVRVYFSHEFVQSLTDSWTETKPRLQDAGVPTWVINVIEVAVKVIKSLDRGRGVFLYCTWGSLWWVTSV